MVTMGYERRSNLLRAGKRSTTQRLSAPTPEQTGTRRHGAAAFCAGFGTSAGIPAHASRSHGCVRPRVAPDALGGEA